MIAAFEALRSEFRSAGAEGISLALVGFAILFFIAEKNPVDSVPNFNKGTSSPVILLAIFLNA